MSCSSGLAWSAAQGTIAALRRADDIPGAGLGLRLVPFRAAVGSGADGSPLVGSQSVHLGIITKRLARGSGGAPAEAGFAVPIETAIGSADGSGKQAPGARDGGATVGHRHEGKL
jgi:hypothetical protein